MHTHTSPYIRTFEIEGYWHYVAFDCTITSKKRFIDTDIKTVHEFIDNLLLSRLHYLNDQNELIQFYTMNRMLYGLFLLPNCLGMIRKYDQYFNYKLESLNCIELKGSSVYSKPYVLPMSENQIVEACHRKKLIQQILEPMAYPVWMREIFITGQTPEEQAALTGFELDPLVIRYK